eukprot:686237-Pelagomonas_calceolata.AAC.1
MEEHRTSPAEEAPPVACNNNNNNNSSSNSSNDKDDYDYDNERTSGGFLTPKADLTTSDHLRSH